jgi:DNA-binding MarR family transcriptional regulator
VTDPADDIAAALARLRGSRPRAPWEGGGPPWARGPGHPFGAHGHDHPEPPRWAGHGRFGGPARLRLLDAIDQAERSLSVSELADAIGVDQPRASRLVQQAVESGMAGREADPDDARRTRVALTEAGRAFVRGFRGQRRDAVRTALADFTDAERAELARLLGRLADAWPRA